MNTIIAFPTKAYQLAPQIDWSAALSTQVPFEFDIEEEVEIVLVS